MSYEKGDGDAVRRRRRWAKLPTHATDGGRGRSQLRRQRSDDGVTALGKRQRYVAGSEVGGSDGSDGSEGLDGSDGSDGSGDGSSDDGESDADGTSDDGEGEDCGNCGYCGECKRIEREYAAEFGLDGGGGHTDGGGYGESEGDGSSLDEYEGSSPSEGGETGSPGREAASAGEGAGEDGSECGSEYSITRECPSLKIRAQAARGDKFAARWVAKFDARHEAIEQYGPIAPREPWVAEFDAQQHELWLVSRAQQRD